MPYSNSEARKRKEEREAAIREITEAAAEYWAAHAEIEAARPSLPYPPHERAGRATTAMLEASKRLP